MYDCDKSAVAGVGSSEKSSLLCHVTSDATGKFTFPCLATGDYTLVRNNVLQ